ncbi:hypothetical protein BC360_25050 [Ensifer sp. LC163]|nr:hypothetical protein BC360_25050 [Ensifer sp. LC163]
MICRTASASPSTGYGLEPGCDATFLLVRAETPADAVASRPVQRAVYRKGIQVAKDGTLIAA